MRIFAATLATETNTFSPLPTGRTAFEESELFPKGSLPDEVTLFTAPVWAARRRAERQGWEVVVGLCASAQPGGLTTRKTYEDLRDQLLADLQSALPVDMVVLGLHGAMVADGYEDCEGDLLERVRSLVGPDVPIGAELDPHCHLSATMLANATIMICYKEYPHTDFAERGEELVDLCAAAARGEINPVMSVHDCRMMGIFHTSREPMRGFVDRIQNLEGRDGILSISVIHGFPWGDVPDRGTKVLVVTDGATDKGKVLADRLGNELSALREQAMPSYLSIREGLDQAVSYPGPVVLADVSDNPGGGSPGDSTFILQAILESSTKDVTLGPFWDPVAVRLCWEAGEGARLPLRIGGKVGPMSGMPLDVDAKVLKLCKDASQAFGSSRVEMGDCAAIRVQNVDIVLTTRRVQAMGRDLFSSLGISLEDKALIVVKSSQHFYASFAPIAQKVLYVAAPGAIVPDLTQIPYQTSVRSL